MTVRRLVKENSSTLLVVASSVGVLGTAYLTGKASFDAARFFHREYDTSPEQWKTWTLKEKTKLVWRLYIPAGAAGAATIVCIAGVKRVDTRKLVAAQGALEVSRRAFESYRGQVIDELGDKKDQIFAARAAEQAVTSSPPLIVAGEGQVLCCELYTGRYFLCDMQALAKAVNEINAKVVKHDCATLDDLYYILGLQQTTESGYLGWTPTKLLELEYSSVIYNDKPVLAFSYNYVKTL